MWSCLLDLTNQREWDNHRQYNTPQCSQTTLRTVWLFTVIKHEKNDNNGADLYKNNRKVREMLSQTNRCIREKKEISIIIAAFLKEALVQFCMV